MLTSSWSRWRVLLVVIPSAALVLYVQGGWFLEVFQSAEPLEGALRDWIQFQRTAERLVAGDLGQLYPEELAVGGTSGFSDWFFFLYPPFAAIGTLPLAYLTPMQAYLACALTAAVVTLVSMVVIARVIGETPRAQFAAAMVTTASAPWNAAVIVGHLSAALLAPPAIALLAWSRHRPVWAGASLGLMMTKPNWGLPLFLLLLIGRRYRMVAGFAAMGTALVAISLPMGLGVWADWLQAMGSFQNLVEEGVEPWKQATVLASLQSVLGRTASDPLVSIPWMAFGGTTMGALALGWWRRGGEEFLFPRLLTLSLMAILVANPYAYFYDALLALPAALLLWSARHGYRSRGTHQAARVLSFTIFIWLWLQFFLLRDAVPSLAGIWFAIWLGLDLTDLLGRKGAAGPLVGSP